MFGKKKNPDAPEHSLRLEITVIFVVLLAAVIVISLLTNILFLNKVYQLRKENVLKNTFETVYQANSEDSIDSDAFAEEMEKVASRNDVSMIVMNASGESLYSTGAGESMLIAQFQYVLFGNQEDTEVLASNDNYVIERANDGMHETGDYLVLFGNLDDSTMVMMRVAMESLHESANISLTFTAVISLIGMIIGAMVIFFVTKTITTPILKLTSISKKMTELDFDAKYEREVGKWRKNEIDQLGQHMNELSYTLENTISELKTANNEMKLDLDRKEQIEQMRTDFLSNVSHELKTPIALIQGYAEGLQESIQDDPDSREFYCEVIIDEATKMNRMVKKLLTLNQLEFGANEITMERFNITELTRAVVNNMQIMLQQDGIVVHFDDSKAIDVWADEFKVEEVLTNYMSNAIHHIGGTKEITITMTPKENVVRISVFNTGTPIPEEDLERLWEKFFKVDKSHSRQYGGSGIGLSIVKAIMDAFHQQCGVLNHADGVEFWFELDSEAQKTDSID